MLGLEVIAEGVEEPFQAGFLKSLSCEYFQGYLTGKPMPVNEFVAFVKDNPKHSTWEAEPAEYLGARYLDKKPKPVKWKKSFSTDIVSIDNEHRALIDALNQFSDQYQNNPENFDVIQVIDGIASEAIKHFAHEELILAEAIGFCEKGQGSSLSTEITGEIPINPSGGAMSGNAPCATGIIRLIEAAKQINGEAKGHQVKDVTRAVASGQIGFCASPTI